MRGRVFDALLGGIGRSPRTRIGRSIVGVWGAVILVLAGCAPAPAAGEPTPLATPTATPTPNVLDSGPIDAVTAGFTTAYAGGMSDQIDFLACVAGGSDATMFSTLFGGLAQLALVSSGVDPEAYWGAVGLTLGDFNATETSRSDDLATVRVQLTITIDPDVAALRELMNASLPDGEPPVDDATVSALIEGLIHFDEVPRDIDQEVTVTQSGGTWSLCEA